MCDSLNRNREHLADLIYEKEHFTEEDLLSSLRKRANSVLIGGEQSVGAYLRELTQLGVLRFEHGHYSVRHET